MLRHPQTAVAALTESLLRCTDRIAAEDRIADRRHSQQRGGRKRNLDTRTEEIHEKLRLRTLHVAPALTEAFADSVLVQVAQLQEINRQLEGLESKLAASTD